VSLVLCSPSDEIPGSGVDGGMGDVGGTGGPTAWSKSNHP